MSPNNSTVLGGLAGTNPLGFLSALGVQAALTADDREHSLHWMASAIPRPVLTPAVSSGDIASAAIALAEQWLQGPALSEVWDPKLKLSPEQIRNYLSEARANGSTGVLASCLLAENSLDNSGKAKPSDLYFTAGQMRFLKMARQIGGEGLSVEKLTGFIVNDLERQWKYNSQRPSLMWDTVDDRIHALSASDPSKEKKLTNPGVEILALLGLSNFPCFASTDRTLTRGCSGGWKRGEFTWPLWNRPAAKDAVSSLLAQVANPSTIKDRRSRWFPSWGVWRVMCCEIRRSDQGGYGTFRPPRVVWQSG